MKKRILIALVVVLALAATASLVWAATPPYWDISGPWDIDFVCTYGSCAGGTFDHHMDVDTFNSTTGGFSGTGYYIPGPYTWTVVGNVSGSDVSFVITYNIVPPILTATGTIGSDGSMSGNWAQDGVGGTWSTTSGQATRLWWWVDDDLTECPDAQYGSIQAAVDDANPGDTVVVCAGTYYENVVINKSLTLQAASSPIIDGGGTLGPGVYITAANVTFQGFTITNFKCTPTAGIGAIWVEGDGATIDSNTIYNITTTGDPIANPAGIGIDVHASDVEVTNNEIRDVGSIGIRVRHDWATPPTTSNNILLEGNTVYRTGNTGVLVTGYAKGVTIKGNEIYESLAPTPYNLFVHYGASDITIGEGNHIHDAYANIVLAGCDIVTIKHNIIEDATPLPWDSSVKGKNIYILSDYGPWYNVDALSTNVSILGNIIRNADGWGVRILNAGAADPSAMAATTTLHFNNISGNTVYGVENQITTAVDATFNWWGDISGPDHPTSWIYMGSPYGPNPGSGNEVSDYVLYNPWLGKVELACGAEGCKNHGQYVRYWARIISPAVDQGLLSEECASSIMSPIAESDVGKPSH